MVLDRRFLGANISAIQHDIRFFVMGNTRYNFHALFMLSLPSNQKVGRISIGAASLINLSMAAMACKHKVADVVKLVQACFKRPPTTGTLFGKSIDVGFLCQVH